MIMLKKENKSLNILRIDANGKKIGRLASEISLILRKKNYPNYSPSNPCCPSIIIENINKISITENQLNSKYYFRYTGHLGSLKKIFWKDIIKQGADKLFLKVLNNMLPRNKNKKNIIRQIKFN